MHQPINYAYLETTNYCNLNCTFCNRDEVIKKLKHMSLNDWELVLEKLKDHPIKEAKLMGLGEPFLHPKFSTICKMFKDYFPNAFLIVATNCQYKLNLNFRDSLKYIDLLYLSIDGYKDSYEKFRPPSKWFKLINFLEELKKTERHKCRITCNYVVNRENITDIHKIDELCKEYNLEELRLNIAQDWSEEDKLSQTECTSGYSNKQISYLKEKYSTNIKGKSPWTWSDCFWVKSGIYMTVEGNLKVCALNTDTASLGNIFKDSLTNILNSKKMNEIRVGCETNVPSKHCENCSYKELSPLLEKLK
ncbi:radical SAM protein [Candidatus Pelagibacter sp.]|nr:radical SAM protein [Candidatus Pelagibacter sp.]